MADKARPVLIAYDGSDYAKAAIKQAGEQLRNGRRAIVLTVWQRIVESAEEHDADILVMGSHGRTGISRVLLGSVAGTAASHTDRPVLIAHDRSQPSEDGDT